MKGWCDVKTRIVHTKIWVDEFFNDLNCEEKVVFIYLITNEWVNLIGCYEVNIRYVSFQTGVKETVIRKAMEKFHDNGKILHYRGWVKIVNADRYNNYTASSKTAKAYQKEISRIPEDVDKYFQSCGEGGGTQEDARGLVEKILGRKLENNEVVHHLDNDTTNNDPKNLAVMTEEMRQKFIEGKVLQKDTSMILVRYMYDTCTIPQETINPKSETRNNKPQVTINPEQKTTNKKQEINNPNENIEKSISYLQNLNEEQVTKFTKAYECNKAQVREMAKKILLYCEAHGKRYSNYRAVLQTWLLKEYKARAIEVREETWLEKFSREKAIKEGRVNG